MITICRDIRMWFSWHGFLPMIRWMDMTVNVMSMLILSKRKLCWLSHTCTPIYSWGYRGNPRTGSSARHRKHSVVSTRHNYIWYPITMDFSLDFQGEVYRYASRYGLLSFAYPYGNRSRKLLCRFCLLTFRQLICASRYPSIHAYQPAAAHITIAIFVK